MIRLSRMADYAVLLMTTIARDPNSVHAALTMAEATSLPVPTVSKVLANMARDGLLESIRGRDGGYRLARAPEAISVEQIISAVDGPIALTVCIEHGPGSCGLENCCPSRVNWRRINDAMSQALAGVSLAEIAVPALPPSVELSRVAAATGTG
ncbi:MAG: SUF system Fe-S cluster assembly regulator [Alphaproteobacteria bacterium]|nr:SUF system Fe-S cluster assembly regulator [Alphaproteobacteria bacterium]